MRNTKTEQQIRKLQELGCMLEKKIGEAADMSLYDGESCLLYRYRDETILAAAELSEKLTGKMRELLMETVTDTQMFRHFIRQRSVLYTAIWPLQQSGIMTT